MKRVSLVLITLVAGAVGLCASQARVVDAQKLQDLLPGAVEGFIRQAPVAAIDQTPFGRVSHAEVGYKTNDQAPRLITVTISDVAENLMAAADIMDLTGPSANDNEKSIKVRARYPGKEKLNPVMSASAVAFVVANRFLVKVEATRVPDIKVLYGIIDTMNLGALEGQAGR